MLHTLSRYPMTIYGILFFLAAGVFQSSLGKPITSSQVHLGDAKSPSTLHGKFLHITDFHPDPFYEIHTSTEKQNICHRGTGPAGTYGAEKSDCDSPFELINATFKWIKDNVKDQVDFVIYTGDSSRHDNDELIPRVQDEILRSNKWITSKFLEVFGQEDNPTILAIPVISTLGNNDILPHNVMLSGPNEWLRAYTEIWSSIIPKDQVSSFQQGGWYHVEVIPNKLAVFSLNTLYFFSKNNMLDGCAEPSMPGYQQFEWLRVELQMIRDRGMKAILIGHVPPARTSSKTLWRESCWQKYTFWLQQYRDVVVGGVYGHMNIDHFLLHDTEEINLSTLDKKPIDSIHIMTEEKLSAQSAKDYLGDLRKQWATLPLPDQTFPPEDGIKNINHRDSAHKGIGGMWGERYQVTLVSPSVVPNFLPTLRVIDYNISGLDPDNTWAHVRNREVTSDESKAESLKEHDIISLSETSFPKNPKSNPSSLSPFPPTKGSPPGPAYSPQPLTFLGYTQYLANLTHYNDEAVARDSNFLTSQRQGEKRLGKHSEDEIEAESLLYQVEYQTYTDPVYHLKDLTLRSLLRLAHRIGQNPSKTGKICSSVSTADENDNYESLRKKKKTKHRKHQGKNIVWSRFVQRAFVGTLEEEELESFDSS